MVMCGSGDPSILKLPFVEKFDRGRPRQNSGLRAARNQFVDGVLAFLAVAERPFVDVHADKLIGEIGFHVARELHGVFQSIFAVLKTILDALADGPGDEAAERRTQGLANGIATQGKRQTSLLLPPDAEVDDLVEAELGEEELALVDEQAGVNKLFLHGVENFVEGHDHGLKVRLKKLEGEVSGGLKAGHGDALAADLVFFYGFRG